MADRGLVVTFSEWFQHGRRRDHIPQLPWARWGSSTCKMMLYITVVATGRVIMILREDFDIRIGNPLIALIRDIRAPGHLWERWGLAKLYWRSPQVAKIMAEDRRKRRWRQKLWELTPKLPESVMELLLRYLPGAG